MNYISSRGSTSFGSAYINPKGAEKFCKTWGNEMTNKLIKTVEKAKNSKENHLILDENGIIKLKNEQYGEFITNNPPRAEVIENVFSCDIRNDDGKVSRFILDMPEEASARRLEESFHSGNTIPEGRMDLFNAMEAAANYKKALINRLVNLSD